MKKLLRSSALMLAMCGMSASLVSVVSNDSFAQDKKKTETKKAEKPGSIEIKEGKDGKFRFSIYDGEGKFMAMSGANTFTNKEDAEKGVERLKLALKDAKIEFAKKDEEKKEKDKE